MVLRRRADASADTSSLASNFYQFVSSIQINSTVKKGTTLHYGNMRKVHKRLSDCTIPVNKSWLPSAESGL